MDNNKSAREQRLAAALRANLQRRKQQARERDRTEGDNPEDSADNGSETPDRGGSRGKS